MAVIHAPPHGPDTGCDWDDPPHPGCDWGENYTEAVAAMFGRDVGEGEGSATGSTTTIGGEVALDMNIDEIGPSFTYGWEKSYSVERLSTTNTVEGSKFSTRAAWVYYDEASDFGNWTLSRPTTTATSTTKPHMATWTSACRWSPVKPPSRWTGGIPHAITMYAELWVPVGINLAQRFAKPDGQPGE